MGGRVTKNKTVKKYSARKILIISLQYCSSTLSYLPRDIKSSQKMVRRGVVVSIVLTALRVQLDGSESSGFAVGSYALKLFG